MATDNPADAFLLAKGKRLEMKKGTLLLRQGETCRRSYRVVKGCLKSYIVDHAGKEHIVQFAPENWFITDMNSFLNDVAAAVSIEAIEDTEAIEFDKQVFQNLEEMPVPFWIIQSKALQNNIIAANKRIILLLSSTAEERYLDFIQTYPSLAQRLPLKLIAAYLGITPESLSRIRKKLVLKVKK